MDIIFHIRASSTTFLKVKSIIIELDIVVFPPRATHSGLFKPYFPIAEAAFGYVFEIWHGASLLRQSGNQIRPRIAESV